MSEQTEDQYVKRTQRDYSHAFKIQVVDEVERGEITQAGARRRYGIQGDATIRNWIEKYGNFDRKYEINQKKMKSPEQKLLVLKQELELLKRKNKSLEKQLSQSDKKVVLFDMMIDIAEKEFQIPIRKKC